MTDKPDGFIAWHPKEGFHIPSFVYHGAGEFTSWLLLIDDEAGGHDFSDLAQPEYDEDIFIERAKREGWIVVPVKLLRLDNENLSSGEVGK